MNKVFSNSVFYIFSSLFPAVVGFILLPIYSRHISPADYGLYALVQLMINFLPTVFSLQIFNSITRFYYQYKDNNNDLYQFLSTIFITMIGLGFFGLGTFYFFSQSILALIFPTVESSSYNLFLLGSVTALANTLNFFPQFLLRAEQRAKTFLACSGLTALGNLCLGLTFVVGLQMGVLGLVIASLINGLLSFLIYFSQTYKVIQFSFSKAMLNQSFRYSLPSIPQALSSIVFLYSDRFILEKFVSIHWLGLYFFADRLSQFVKNLVNQFNVAFGPHFFDTANKSKDEAVKMAQHMAYQVTSLLTLALIGYFLFAPELHYLLFDKSYFDTWFITPILCSAYFFRSLYCFSSAGLFYEKKTGLVAMINITSGILNLVINILFIPKYGVLVAAWSTVAAFACNYILAEAFSARIYPLGIRKKWVWINTGLVYLGLYGSWLINRQFTSSDPFLQASEYALKVGILLGLALVYYRLKALDIVGISQLRKRKI